MDVRKVALPAAFAPYSSWNSSLSSLGGSTTFTMTCENGAIVALDACDSHRQVKVLDQLLLGPVGLERFCHTWSTPTNALAIAHGDILFLYDHKLDRRFELQLPYFAKHIAFHGSLLIVSTSNGAYIYHVCQTSLHCTLEHHLYRDVPVGVAAISLCGTCFGIGAIDGRVSFWNAATMETEFSTTLPSSRPTSLVFSGGHAIVACKDAHVATFQRDPRTSTWSSAFQFNLKPFSTPASGYLSSTLVAFWPALPTFFCVAHSSYIVDIVDASSGRRVHHIAFPSHVHVMGLVALGNMVLMQDLQGQLYSITWAFANAITGSTAQNEARVVHSGSFGTLLLERQALRRVARTGQATTDVIPMPFVPPHLDSSTSLPFSAHWIRPDCVCVAYGDAIYRYSRGAWAVAVVPTGVLQIAYSPEGALEMVVLGHEKLAVLSLDTLDTTCVIPVPPEVAQRGAYHAPTTTVSVHREESGLVVRLMADDVEVWQVLVK